MSAVKYLILIGDGMADRPLKGLGGKTPLMVARTPNMDRLADEGELGLVRTIPPGFPKGSEIANLAILGYDPARYYTGRGPLEAASIGVRLAEDDCAFRLNLVTLEAVGGDVIMQDYSAGHISTEEGRVIIEDLDRELGNSIFRFYPGVSYRHLLVWKGDGADLETTPPHDITAQSIGHYLPRGKGAARLIKLMTEAQLILHEHPVNQARRKEGKPAANATWPWGQGRAPQMPTLHTRFGITGSVISAVDLIKGIGIYAGLRVIEVPGATGYLDTNYKGKGQYALAALQEDDLVYVHVEAPDEASHSGDVAAKIAAIEAFDELVLGTILSEIKEEHRILLLPDHPTPIEIMTHSAEPVPYVIYDSTARYPGGGRSFSEEAAAATGLMVEQGHLLIERLFKGGG